MKITAKILLTISTILSLFFISCNNDNKNINVSNIKVNLNIVRFDNILFSIKPDSLENKILDLNKKYTEFIDIFGNRIINIGGTNNANFIYLLKNFLTDYDILQVQKQVSKKYSDINDIKSNLTNAFKHYKFYYPDKKIPLIYTTVTGFNQSIIITDSLLIIGLDKYMGTNYDYYSRLQIPYYMRKNMNRENIVPDCIRAVAIADFPFYDSLNNVISNMVYEGKIQYFINSLLPDYPDSLKFRYTNNQLKWLDNSEKSIWEFMVDKELLFSTKYMDIKRFTQDGPFTPAFSNDSPPRAGSWLGYRIVCNYMKNNPKIKLQDLMKENDYQKILNLSKYNP
ncbi:MAG: hypothetical protein DRI94_12465 [Bacteroidetes bacterium]|nr:MAG: hypothetical protein DRI94_12465 [Bacteroidota bacterium]